MRESRMGRAVQHVRRHAIAYVALFAAVGGGTAIAAKKVKLPRNSVGPKQIKAGAVDTSKVKDGSLTNADFATGTIPPASGPSTPAPTEVVERTFRVPASAASDELLASPPGLGEVRANCNTGDPVEGLALLSFTNTSAVPVHVTNDSVYDNGINDQVNFNTIVVAPSTTGGGFTNFRTQRHQIELISEEATPRAATVNVAVQTGDAACRFHVITLGG
jgi:hypothetical protein